MNHQKQKEKDLKTMTPSEFCDKYVADKQLLSERLILLMKSKDFSEYDMKTWLAHLELKW